MTPYYTDDAVTLYVGDCLDVLREIPAASVDAVCTDPPYGLEFMGKEWDSFRPSVTANRGGGAPGRSVEQEGRWVAVEYGTAKRRTTLTCDGCGKSDKFKNPHGCPEGTGWTRIYLDSSANNVAVMRAFQAWCEAWAAECLRVLRPGGHLLAFGGTRTWHRLACAVEDAGFEVRDSIAWLYGSGFPKSLDVSKAIDRAAGAEREVVGVRTYGDGHIQRSSADKLVPPIGTFVRAQDDRLDTAPATDAARQWQGWGTALKPSHEPIVVARKPLTGTVAQNVTTHGTGALNIDGCRVGRAEGDRTEYGRGRELPHANTTASLGRFEKVTPYTPNDSGRWPANVVLDETAAAELDQQSGTSTSPAPYIQATRAKGDVYGLGSLDDKAGKVSTHHGDSGGSSRFFPVFRYEPKAPATERPRLGGKDVAAAGVHNNRCAKCGRTDLSGTPCVCDEPEWIPRDGGEVVAHPTVKPLDLMRWLVRLVCPPGGVVLDPFLGSGTTAEACVVEGFRCIGVERDPDYLRLAVARLSKPIAPVLFGEDTA